jgi:hypothetical protein
LENRIKILSPLFCFSYMDFLYRRHWVVGCFVNGGFW